MKNIFKISGIIIYFILMQSCLKDKPTIPVVTTVSITEITRTSANSGGNVTDDGGVEVNAYGICWGNSSSPTISGSKTKDGVGKGSFTSNITTLSPNTKYYVKAYATNSIGTAYGNELFFTTNSAGLPIVSTWGPGVVTSSFADVGGIVDDDGGSSITLRGVCWSTLVNPTIADSKTIEGAGLGSFNCRLTNLKPNNVYYASAYATNSVGTAYGYSISFNTKIGIPSLTTSIVTDISASHAKSGGNITSDGGSPIITRGVNVSQSKDFPYWLISSTFDGTGIGTFNSNIANLTANITYFVRAYATNSAGTGYGETLNFKTTKLGSDIIFNPSLTYGSITDIDGNIYKTIQIGSQVWMAENLRTTKYKDGILIPYISDSLIWNSISTPGFCWLENDIQYKSTAGALYNWYAVNTKNLCPSGWHIPKLNEISILSDYLGKEVAGGKIKETGTAYWSQPNEGATNESGFSAIASGKRYNYGFDIGYGEANWWTSETWWQYTEPPEANIWKVTWNSSKIGWWTAVYNSGYSIRCIKD